MTVMLPLETVIEAIKGRDRAFFDQFDADLPIDNPAAQIQWSLTYDKSCLHVEWDIHVLLTGGYVSFVVCDLTQGQQDIGYSMDMRNTDITVVKQGDYKGWLNVAYNPVRPVEVKATIFGSANAPGQASQFFRFEKKLNIQ